MPSTRPRIARERAVTARAMLANCHLCAHHCGVNRLAGEQGLCRAGARTRFFSAQFELGDEAELSPTFAIALSGCDLRCDFCITGRESWNPRAGDGLASIVAAEARRALAEGARSVMLLGGEPTIHLPAALEFVAVMPGESTLVWKTNAHGSEEARELLDGMFDIWVADFKFGNDQCALRLAKAPDYGRVARSNLRWAFARTELIVRHLLMPGHVECCWRPIAEWLADALPRAEVSLRYAFWPAWHSWRQPELRTTTSPAENERAREIAREHRLNLVH